MKNRILLIISGIIISGFNLFAQNSCGTYVTPAQKTLESGINIASAKANESVSQLNRQLSVSVYIIKDSTGIIGVSNATVQSAINQLNNAFSAIKLSFNVCNTIVIDNYQFNTINAGNEKDLLIQYNTPKTINLYFATFIIDSLGNFVDGYTYMPSRMKDVIFLTKQSATGSEIIHQFGHFFNLYHTNETEFGAELVKGSNCSTTGDKCCDTPADPNLTGLVSNECIYSASMKDSQKIPYAPSVSNYMSLSKNSCRCSFTNDQYSRVIYAVQNFKNYLW
jgi:hypothetical protein